MKKKKNNRRQLYENSPNFIKKDYPEIDTVIFLSRKLGFALTVIGFSGKKQTEDFVGLFENENDMNVSLEKYLCKRKEKYAEQKPQKQIRQEAQKEALLHFNIGDIISYSKKVKKNYLEIIFYQIIEKKGITIILRELEKELCAIEDTGVTNCIIEYVVPIKNKFIATTTITKRITRKELRFEHGTGEKWNGLPQCQRFSIT